MHDIVVLAAQPLELGLGAVACRLRRLARDTRRGKLPVAFPVMRGIFEIGRGGEHRGTIARAEPAVKLPKPRHYPVHVSQAKGKYRGALERELLCRSACYPSRYLPQQRAGANC